MKAAIASGLIVIMLILAVAVSLINAGNEFRETCRKLGGTPVHDGRQNTCLGLKNDPQ